MQKHIQKTLVIIKPDGVQRTLIGEIIGRFEGVGLKLVGMKMVVADIETVRQHYSSDPNWKQSAGEKVLANKKKKGEDVGSLTADEMGERILVQLTKFMTAGPVVAMTLEGAHAIELTRKMVGGTEPLTSDVGTIRGDFVLDSYALADESGRAVRNIIHASSSVEDAAKEIALWFRPEELLAYNTVHERILYDVNLDNDVE